MPERVKSHYPIDEYPFNQEEAVFTLDGQDFIFSDGDVLGTEDETIIMASARKHPDSGHRVAVIHANFAEIDRENLAKELYREEEKRICFVGMGPGNILNRN